MRRIDPGDLWFHVLNALFRARRSVGHPLRNADQGIVEQAARIAFDEIFRDENRILIEPDRVVQPVTSKNLLPLVPARPGRWGENEQRPTFSNDPPPPPIKRVE